MLAYDYPILGIFWTAFIVFIWMAWLILLFQVFVDIFRSDMRGLSKGLVDLRDPLRSSVSSCTSSPTAARWQNDGWNVPSTTKQATARTCKQPPTDGTAAGQLTQLADLRNSGALTDAEFEAQKARILAS